MVDVTRYKQRAEDVALESQMEDVGIVQDKCESLGELLYLRGDYSDVDLVVDGTRLPCHKAVLATRSEYFRALLYGGMKESRECEVKLEVSSLTAFKEVLRYIYTGHMRLYEKSEETVLEILGLSHQCGLIFLQNAVSDYLKTLINLENVYPIFQAAKLYQLVSLTDLCRPFIHRHAVEILKQDFICNLSSDELIEIVSSDCLRAPEVDIFRAVAKWAKQNKETNCKDVVDSIRFSLMSLKELLHIVRPEQIVSDKVILDAVQVISESSGKKLPFRCGANEMSGREENVASPKRGAEVLSGEESEGLLYDDQNRPVGSACTWHDIGNDQGIVIKLGAVCAINCIKLRLRDEVDFCYHIKVSMDMSVWHEIVDYRNYVCCSVQELHFAVCLVKYIKIVGTWSSSEAVNKFQITSFECMYTDRFVQLEGDIVAPSENVALIEKHAHVIQGASYGDRNVMINGCWGDVTDCNAFTYHAIRSEGIIVQLAQPYMLDSMRLRLWDGDSRSYRYYVEVSKNKREWTIIADKTGEDCKSWQLLSFAKTPVVYIRITGTHCTTYDLFHILHLECPSQNM